MILRFAVDSIINNLRHSVITIFLLIVSTLLIIFSTMISVGHDYAYKSVDELLCSGADNTAVLRLEENNVDFMNELSRQPEISAIGCSTKFGIDYIPELYKIQKKYKEDIQDYLEVIEINKTVSTLCDINLMSGSKPDNLDYTPRNNKTVEYMYLGSCFSDIAIGTEYETKYTIFIVAGILNSSQKWLNETLLCGFDINTMDYTIDCKSSIFSFYDGPPSSSDMWVCASKNYNIDQVINVVYKIAKKYNLDVRYTTLKTSYERASEDWIILNSILSKLIVIVFLSCVLMLLCYQLYRLIIMKREMGIMLSIGFSIKEINYSMILSNIILSAISFALTIPLSLLVVRWWFQSNDITEILHKILLNYSYPTSFAVIVLIIIITSVLLTKFLNKITPLEMIGGQND